MRRQTAALVLAWVLAVAVPATAQTAADGALPADIFAEWVNRLPLVRPAARGVEAIRLHASGVDVRWQSPLGRQLTELAILTTAREHDQPYEWSLHESTPSARAPTPPRSKPSANATWSISST